jgi:hypothetical protein
VQDGIVRGKVAKKEKAEEVQRAVDERYNLYRTLGHFEDYLFLFLLTFLSKAILTIQVTVKVVFLIPL